MSQRRFDLTSLDKLPTTGKRYRVHDPATRGLALRVEPSGAKAFYWTRRVGHRVREVRLGDLADFRLVEDVRAIAERHNATLRQGVDPATEKRRRREALTFGELADLYLAKHAELGKRALYKDRSNYRVHLARWAKREVREITRPDAVRLLEGITAKSGPVAANRVRALAHRLFTWGMAAGLGVEGNPFAGTPRNREHPKERYLGPEELRRFWQALAEEPDNDVTDFCRMMLLTAARGHSVAAARWVDIDLGRTPTWRIPAESMKAGRALTLPLAGAVARLLRNRHEVARSEWLFPSPVRAAEHLAGMPREGWRRVLKRAGITGLSPHCLRRTFATIGQAIGVPVEVLSRVLGHTVAGGITANVYAMSTEQLARLAVERTAHAILAVAEAPNDADGERVLALPRPSWAIEAGP